MDLDLIKQKLSSFEQKKGNYQKSDRVNHFWKPSVGKQVIRIVPNKFNKNNPFTELRFYYGIGDKNVMISPTNFGGDDPIYEFVKELYKTNNRDNWALAKQLKAKNRYFAPVLVRGEEDQGVKLWQFGTLVYKELLSIAMDEEIGDYTDVYEGRDITVETVGPEVTGTRYNKSSVRVKIKQTPISEDKAKVEKYLDEQVNPAEIFKKYTFEEMKAALQSHLSPEDTPQEGDIIDDDKPAETNYTLNSGPKKSKADEFDELFGEEDSKKGDDLPF